MKNFGRAVRIALRNRFTLLGAFACSLMVAMLWCANIGTVYPFVEVVFQGKSMHEWVDDELAESKKTLKELDAKIAKLRRKREAAAKQWSTEQFNSPPNDKSLSRCSRAEFTQP